MVEVVAAVPPRTAPALALLVRLCALGFLEFLRVPEPQCALEALDGPALPLPQQDRAVRGGPWGRDDHSLHPCLAVQAVLSHQVFQVFQVYQDAQKGRWAHVSQAFREWRGHQWALAGQLALRVPEGQGVPAGLLPAPHDELPDPTVPHHW